MRGDSGSALPIPEEEPATGLTSDSIPLTMFSSPGAAGFKVRGPNYLQDKKKVNSHPWEASYPLQFLPDSYDSLAEADRPALSFWKFWRVAVETPLFHALSPSQLPLSQASIRASSCRNQEC